MAKKNAGNVVVVADICLYGNGPSGCGSGYIAATPDGRTFGDGEPRPGRSMTEAVWLAWEELKGAGLPAGVVRIFAAGGGRMATVPTGSQPPYFGALTWGPAVVYVISAEEIERAAAEQAAEGR